MSGSSRSSRAIPAARAYSDGNHGAGRGRAQAEDDVRCRGQSAVIMLHYRTGARYCRLARSSAPRATRTWEHGAVESIHGSNRPSTSAHRSPTPLRDHVPVVALESTLIAHGLPWPDNLEAARAAEAAVRAAGGRAGDHRRTRRPADRRLDR